MDESAKALLRQLKSAPSLQGYLQLAAVYKRSGKFFSAQSTLAEAFAVLKPASESLATNQLAEILAPMTETLGDDYKQVGKSPASVWFLPACLLSELHLLQGHTAEATNYAVFAARCYSDSPLNAKTYWNVLACVLLECWLKWAYVFMYRKKFERAVSCYSHLQTLCEFFGGAGESQGERLSSVLGTVHLSRFLVLKDAASLQVAGRLLASVHSGESLLCYLYLTKDKRASEVVRKTLETHSTTSSYWIWLGLIENSPAALRKALSLEAKNWLAWLVLSYLQYKAGSFEDCAYSLRLAHKLNYQDYRLPLLRSVLCRDIGKTQEATELASFAVELEPSLGIYQVIENR